MIRSRRNRGSCWLSGVLFAALLTFGNGAFVVSSPPTSLMTTTKTFHPWRKGPSFSSTRTRGAISVPRGGGVTTTRTALQASPLFDNGPFWKAQIVLGGVNALGFVISLATGSHLHLDLLGTGAFSLAAGVVWKSQTAVLPPRVTLSSAAVALWGAKLAGFLFYRALQTGHDARLDNTLSTTSGTVGFWVISLLWGCLCSLPHTLGTTSMAPGNPVLLQGGTLLYVVGLVIETVADLQKYNFKQSHPGQFCNVGLWSVSQHPSYLGNLLLWGGIFLMNADALVGPPSMGRFQRFVRLGLALLSPWFLWTLFWGQANGSITDAVALAQQKYGSDPAFQEYVKTVPLIFPKPLGRSPG